MSAYMVDKAHIDVLIRGGLDLGIGSSAVSWYTEDPRPVAARAADYTEYATALQAIHHTLTAESAESADDTGDMLRLANLHSIAHRYPDTLTGGDIPGPLDEWYVLPYRYRDPGFRPSPVEILKAADGYEYQACEPDDWQDSSARRFLDALRSHAIGRLDGYGVAPWEWSAERIAQARAAHFGFSRP